MSDIFPVIYDTLVTDWQDTSDSLSQEQQKHNAQYVTRFFTPTTASKDCIIALLCNMSAESTTNPRKIERRYVDGVINGFGNGGGLIQWTPYRRIDEIVAVSPYGGSWADGGEKLFKSELWAIACGLGLITDETGTYGVNWSGSPSSALVAEFGTPMLVEEFTSKRVGDTYHGGEVTREIFVWSYLAKRLVPQSVVDGNVSAVRTVINRMLSFWSWLDPVVNETYKTSYAYWLLWYIKEKRNGYTGVNAATSHSARRLGTR